MQIKKILNNNVIVTEDENGCEVVAMGRGLAFGKKNGDSVEDGKVDKVYRLSDHDMLEKFKELLSGLRVDYLDASTSIIEMAEKELGVKLNETVYISLTDHIHMAIHRLREGINIRNLMLWETRRFYPKEFAIAEKAVLMLEAQFDIDIPEDEAGFIAMHISRQQPAPRRRRQWCRQAVAEYIYIAPRLPRVSDRPSPGRSLLPAPARGRRNSD